MVADVADEQAGHPARRGRLIIDDRVVERIATLAAREVEGVAESGSSLESIVGRRYPKADAHTAGGHTAVSIELAVTWPMPLGTLTGRVRDHVLERLHSLTGLTVDSVHVTASKVVHAERDRTRRVK